MVRRTSLIALEIVAGLLTGMVAIGGLVAWRLHAGPVPLDFLTPYLEESLKTEGRGYTVDIDETVAVWAGWRNAVDIVATNVIVTTPDGSTLARVPELSLGLSLRALIRGNLAPTSLDAVGPSVRVIRKENGEFALGFVEAIDGSQPEDANVPPRAEPSSGGDVVNFLVDELLGDPDTSRSFGYLRRISILGGQVVFEDRVAGSYFRSPDAEIVLRKGETGIIGNARLKLQYGGRQANFTIRTGIEKRDLGYFAELNFTDVQPAAFATSLPPQLSAVTALSMPISGSINLHGKLKGELESFDFDLLGSAGKLELTDLYREPLNVRSLRVRGNATGDFSTVRIEQAIVDLDDAVAVATATLEPNEEGGGVRASLHAEMEDFGIHELHRFWPVSAQPGAREWVTTNIYEGIVDKGTIDLALIMGDEGGVKLEKLEGTLAYTDLGINYFKEMTPVVDIDGAGTFDRHGFYLGIDDGSLAENIKVMGGHVDVIDMDKKGEARLVIDVKAEGPIATALKVLDEDPLNYGDKLGFDSADLGGESSSDLHFDLPLIKGLTGAMLNISATGKLTGVSAPKGPFNLAISKGALDLQVTRDDMQLAGDVRLNGVPAEIVWKENFEPDAKYKRRFEVKASPDDAQRLALGLPDLSYWIAGTAPTELTYTVVAKRAPELVIRSDLTSALVRIPEAAWQKEPGEPGRLEIDARVLKEGNLIFDRLNVKTGDAEGTVKIEFLSDMSDIAEVTLQDLRYRDSDVRGVITLRENGGYRIDVEGDRVDVRHFLTDEFEKTSAEAMGGDGGADRKGKPLSIKANFKEAITGDDRRMYRGAFNGAYDGGNWEAVVLYATLGQGAELRVNYGKGEKGYELLVESNDAGQALRSLGWWDEIQGGSMAIDGRRQSIDAPLTGNIRVKDFRMKEAPAGVKLLQIITLVGAPAAAAAGEGISFAGYEGSYAYHDGLLTFGEVEAWGPVGVHVDKGGWMNFNENTIEMQGVVVPANTLQQFFGIIPGLGLLFQEGLIAANFKVSGKLDDPKVVGSAASFFALGFLRKLFRLKGDPNTDQPGTERPSQRD